MIRRLIILLLIVGCEDEPEGACVFLVGVDSITFAISFSDTLVSINELFHFKCEDNYIEDNCCSAGIYPNAGRPICDEQEELSEDPYCINSNLKVCNESLLINSNGGYLDSLNPNPTYWINNESCSQYCQEADCD